MITKEEAKEKIKQLVKEFSEIPKAHLDSMPEEDIKRIFITPLLEYLGWGKFDILSEARVLKGRADYILKNGNQELLVVEAKKTNVSLTEEEGRQAVSYAYHRKIKFSVLTNFKYIRVYHALSNIKNIDKNLLRVNNDYFRLGFEEFLDKFDILWLLSKESFENGEIKKLLSSKDEKINKPIDENILNDLLKIREWLSKELKAKKNYLKQEDIDEIVQILIDRLIFIRSVEDMKLEPENFLLGLDSDVRQQRVKLQFFPYLISKFEEFNKKYDSKLFEPNLLEKEGAFSEDTLHKVIRALYFGVEERQSKYMFDEIPGDLFGSIYEQYLGTILSGTEKRVKLEGGTGKRKKMGIYYTPSYIVDYIVKNTVGEYIKDKDIDEILKVKIVDPACGSGSFLVRAFQEFCDKIEELLKKNNKSEKPTFKEYKGRLNLAQKITILLNCIYGVDLDEKAVELAGLRLLLRILDGEGQETKKLLLPHLENNIKCGNSLIDDSKIVGDKAFNWNAQFPEVFRQGGFNIVIGNPPYVSIDPKLKKISSLEFNFIKEKYKTFMGQTDLYIFFYELGHRLLDKQGILSFISKNRWMNSPMYKNYRIFLSDKNIKVIDFDEAFIFEGVGTTTNIIFIKKNLEPNVEYYLFDNSDLENVLNFEHYQIFKNKKVNKEEWNIFSDDIIDKVKREGEFILYGGSGHKITPSKFFLLLKDKENYIPENKEIREKIQSLNLNDFEKTFVKKFVSSGDLFHYYMKEGRYIIYPENLDLKKTPNLKRYFEKIREQEYGIRWYEYHGGKGYRNINLIKNDEKIICPSRMYLNRGPSFNLVGDDFQIGMDGNAIKTKKETSMKYILGILNSKLMWYFYRKNFKRYASRQTIEIEKIPIKIPNKEEEKTIIDLVNQMLELQKKYHDEKIQGNKKEMFEQQIKNIDYEIDEEVYKLYGITEEEKKVIEESLK
jgi:mRNA-degrading endonuclease YafQ of YafQ-DinJ toxin-antitoxin module